MATQSDSAKFADLTKQSMLDQAKFFLREFVFEVSSSEDGFEGVLKLCEEFAGFSPSKTTDTNEELEEHTFHLFLERRGETKTVKEVRDAMKEIDLDSNLKISFIELCLFRFKKTIAELFAPKTVDPRLLAELNEAIALFEEVMRARQEEEDTMAALAKEAEGSGVKAMKAKMQLESMRVRSQTGQNIAEVRAAFKKRQAEKKMKNAPANGPTEEERMAQLALENAAVEKKQKEAQEAEAFARAESKRKLKERAEKFS